MRLVNAHTHELRSFNDNEIPDYAILSHTWGADEVTYQELVWINRIKLFSSSIEQPPLSSSFASFGSQDEQTGLMLASMEMMLRGNWNPNTPLESMTEEDLLKRHGYCKIIGAARETAELKLDWIWIDTCCIDKSSSAELQESINSMYRWYKDAEVCLIYLDDVSKPARASRMDSRTASEVAKHAFATCRWGKRGWTLQELIAPAYCRFYFQDWAYMGEKNEFLDELSSITGVPASVLDESTAVIEVSVAERMSWAAHRETTRSEDIAYCLLGLFDIQMPLLYGEGPKAFIRLQEEILKTTDDHSLFAWSVQSTDPSIYRGLLARSPQEFRSCRSIDKEDSVSIQPISSTAIGLRIQLEFLPDPNDPTCVLGMIRSTNALNQRLAIHLKCLDGVMQFARVNAGSLIAIDDWPTGTMRNIYVRQKLSIPPAFTTKEFSAFHVKRRHTSTHHRIPNVRIIGAHPRQLFDWSTYSLRIPPESTETNGLILLRIQSHTYAHSLSFPIAFGFSRTTGHYWCKAVTYTAESDKMYDVTGEWEAAALRKVPDEVRKGDGTGGGEGAKSDIAVFGNSGLAVGVDIKAGLVGDGIVLVVGVDGLVRWS